MPRKPPDNRQDETGLITAAKLVEEYTRELEKARTVSRQTADAQEALGKALGGLKEALPAAGGLIKAFTNPLAGAVEVGEYLIKSTIEGIKKMMDSISEDVSFEKLTDVFLKQKRALEDASIAAKLYDQSVRDIAQHADTPTEAAEKSIQALKEQQSAQDRVADARKNAEQKHVEATEANPLERARKVNEIEEKYAKEKAARDQAAAAASLQAKREAVSAEETLALKQGDALKADREKLKKLNTPATMDAIENADRNNLKKTEEEMAKKQARVDELKEKSWFTRSTPEQAETNYLTQEIEEMEGVKGALQRKIAADERVFGKKREEYAVLQDRIKKEEEEEKGAVKRATEGRRKLDEEERQDKLRKQTDEEVERYKKSSSKDEATIKQRQQQQDQQQGAGGPTPKKPQSDEAKHYEIPRTNLESKGFILNGRMATDNSAVKTADNTTIMVSQLHTLIAVSGNKNATAAATNAHAQ